MASPMFKIRRAAFAGGILMLSTLGSALADPPVGEPRLSYPNDIAPWARPSDTGRYIGYQVGGGNYRPHRAEPPTADEGTWGWDYTGGHIRRFVNLGWWHGRKEQGSTGAYKTDGPKLVHE